MIQKKFSDKEFISRRDNFLNSLHVIQQKYSKWFDKNLEYYKSGGRPTLGDMIHVLYDNDKITVNIGLKNIPDEIMAEINLLKIKYFDA